MNTARAVLVLCALALVALVGLILRPPVVVAVTAAETPAAAEPDPDPDEADSPEAPASPTAPSAARPPASARAGGDRRSDAELTAAALSVLPADALATRFDVSLGALRRGELGAGLQGCIGGLGALPMEEARSRTGTDFLTAIEQATVTDSLAVIAGRFDGTRWGGLDVGTEERRGARGRVFTSGHTSSETLAVYDDRLMIVARDREAALSALDRLERGDAPTPAALAGRTRGEIQGVLPAAGLLGEVPIGESLRDGLRDGLAQRGARLEYNLSVVDGGLQVSARLIGADGLEGVEALVTGLEAGLESVRTAAAAAPRAEHDPMGDAVSQILSRARLSRAADGFTLDLDVPADVLQGLLTHCAAAQTGFADGAVAAEGAEIAGDPLAEDGEGVVTEPFE